MNFLDIILIILCAVVTFGIIILQFLAIKDEEYGVVVGSFIVWIIFMLSIFGIAWIRIDKRSGSTIGVITSVDKNFFGTTALYIKTTETNEEEYCIENEDIAEVAKSYIGKKVNIHYGTRVGIYSTGACDDAPIDDITLIDE